MCIDLLLHGCLPSNDTLIEVNFTALKEQCGIRAIVFDKDNTLTAPYDLSIHPNATAGFESAMHTFGRDNVAILSNSAGTGDDHNYEDAKKIELNIDIPVIRHLEKKPGGLSEVMNHFGTETVSDPSQICIIGDRLLTDIVFGNLYGMLTIHCDPLCSGAEKARDNFIASVIHSMENKVMYGNWFGSRMLRERRLKHSLWNEELPIKLSS